MVRSLTPVVLAPVLQASCAGVSGVRPLIGKALNTGENRLGIEVRFSNDIGFEAASKPLVVPIRE